jgi:hypothetical protein
MVCEHWVHCQHGVYDASLLLRQQLQCCALCVLRF